MPSAAGNVSHPLKHTWQVVTLRLRMKAELITNTRTCYEVKKKMRSMRGKVAREVAKARTELAQEYTREVARGIVRKAAREVALI